jgi:hypothetical protein
MNIIDFKKIYMHIILICFFPGGLFAYNQEDCVKCHNEGSSGSALQISVTDFYNSVHGREMTCEFCHTAIVDESHMKEDSDVSVNCGNCHDQENLHGASSEKDNKPECYSCHTKHRILPKSIAGSSIHETQLKKTCGVCHPAEWGEHGYFAWFASVRVRSHKKQDFSEDYKATDCIGCHQGMAVHGNADVVNDETCYQCHMNNNQNALMGTFHPGKKSGVSVLGISILSQLLILIIFIYLIGFFIIKPLGKSGKREE